MRILMLDSVGSPCCWLSRDDAITYHAKKQVSWQLGDGTWDVLYRGGINRLTGEQSQLVTAPIIAIKGRAHPIRQRKTPALTNARLFQRDRNICAYCGNIFHFGDLSRDHIVPTSRGGLDVWTNVATACLKCNNAKGQALLGECGLELQYVPYAPNLAEALILENRNIIACQMEYLLALVPEHSRLKTDRRQ